MPTLSRFPENVRGDVDIAPYHLTLIPASQALRGCLMLSPSNCLVVKPLLNKRPTNPIRSH